MVQEENFVRVRTETDLTLDFLNPRPLLVSTYTMFDNIYLKRMWITQKLVHWEQKHGEHKAIMANQQR